MMNSRLDNRIKLVLWLVGLLAITSCHNNTNGQATSATKPTGPMLDTNSSPSRIPMESGVTLRVREHTEGTLTVELKNETDRPVYVSYVRPKEGNEASFLVYGLERKTKKGDFKPCGFRFHFVPKLNPLGPRTTILFRVLNLPTENGEYRLLVNYDDDEDVVRLINEKAPNWSDSEVKRIEQARKLVRSETFVILSKPMKKSR